MDPVTIETAPGYLGSAEDFVVEEIPLYEPCGDGGHTFLWVEKRLLNTDEVAKRLARMAQRPPRDVGYAGRKDRFAVTRQSFSVPDLEPEAALRISGPGFRVLRAVRHRNKLRTGQLSGNRFDIRVRGVSRAAIAHASKAAEGLLRVGLPNRFGRQRFGRREANIERGRRLLAGEAVRGDRREARFLVSSLQAAVFNEVLRTRPLALDRVELGDLARRTDSGGLFRVEDAAAESLRAARFEISATGPIFGTRMQWPGDPVAERERVVLERFGLPRDEELRPPSGLRIRGGRRPLRVPLKALRVESEDAGVLRLRFELPPGSYATVVLAELLGFEPDSRVPSGFEPVPHSEVSSGT
jgi:tRNA pseudouridine13 synthase